MNQEGLFYTVDYKGQKSTDSCFKVQVTSEIRPLEIRPLMNSIVVHYDPSLQLDQLIPAYSVVEREKIEL